MCAKMNYSEFDIFFKAHTVPGRNDKGRTSPDSASPISVHCSLYNQHPGIVRLNKHSMDMNSPHRDLGLLASTIRLSEKGEVHPGMEIAKL